MAVPHRVQIILLHPLERSVGVLHLGQGRVCCTSQLALAPSSTSRATQAARSSQRAGACASPSQAKQKACPAAHTRSAATRAPRRATAANSQPGPGHQEMPRESRAKRRTPQSRQRGSSAGGMCASTMAGGSSARQPASRQRGSCASRGAVAMAAPRASA